MKEFNSQILKAFNLKHKKVYKAFGNYICETDQGLKLVKNIYLPLDQLFFTHSVKEHLYNEGMTAIDRYEVTETQQPYFEYNKNIYIVKTWVKGLECDLLNPAYAKKAIEALALMHSSSKNMVPCSGSRIDKKYKSTLLEFNKNYKELTMFYKQVRRLSRWTNFDIQFIKNYRFYLQNAEKAIEKLDIEKYHQFIETAEQNKMFCHNNFTNHNIYFNREDTFIANFENACYQLSIIDFVRIFEKTMRKNNWDTSLGMELVECYNKVKTLEQEELLIMYCLLLFPKRLWSLSNQNYSSKRSWMPKIYENKMEKLIEQQTEKERFLTVFSELL